MNNTIKHKSMNSYIYYLKSSLLAFFLPIHGILIMLLTIILLDTITGIIKTVRNKGWRSFTSRKFSDIVGKILLYEITIMLLFPVDYYLLNEFTTSLFSVNFFFTKIVASIFILIEITSIKENLEEAFKINIWDKFKNLLQRTKEIKDEIDSIR